MERVRVLSPAISGTAHAVAAGVLTFAPFFLADRLPAPPAFDSVPQFDGPVVLLAGGASPHGEAGPPRVSPPPAPARPVPPVEFAVGVPAPDARPDLGSIGPEGIGDPSDEAPGLCLFDCGAGPGLRAGTAPVPLEPVRSPSRVRVGGDIRVPAKVRDVAPVYPPLATAARVQGPVVLQCVITTEGRVSEIVVVSGHPLLREAAAAAVRGWRYRPTLLNGEPVSVVLTVTVTFSLRQVW